MGSQLRGFQPSGRLYLMIAILIFGAANAVTRKLTDIGAQNLIDGRNPISFCNVLFVGNLCALGLLLLIYHKQLRPSILKQITFKQWLTLTLIAILSAVVVPMLVFTALSLTAVNNVILIGQVDAPLVLALSVLLLGDRVNGWVIAGAIVSFIGVSLTVLLQPPAPDMVNMGMGLEIGQGEFLTLLAAVFKAVSNLVSKISLREIPLGVFNIYRMLVGTVIFFGATLVLFNPEHLMDVTSPFLWQWMLLYSAVIVVGGQLAWFNGLKRSSASEVSFATAFNPIAGVLAAYALLGEVPTRAQYIGGVVILGGIVLNQIGVQRLNKDLIRPKPAPAEMSDKVLYKGV
ncbi:DMT family transporter [Oscillatoria sp. CS-180]|uniref:DMT family transporter n=1 Tax=Oscillatoria sp. CS-180 TaxID=3021720 RepID=UPI00232C97C2|nr:DMT family transporter [Oscillatoria sp. CS-180]MDB9526592.1 DMT family transporter [Oscillatoria sp. CS-180]